MAKKKAPQTPHAQSPLERLGLRVSAMIQSPRAQLDRRVMVHRLDTDTDEAWEAVMELIAEEGGIEQNFNDDGSVTLTWPPREDEPVAEASEAGEEEAPF